MAMFWERCHVLGLTHSMCVPGVFFVHYGHVLGEYYVHNPVVVVTLLCYRYI